METTTLTSEETPLGVDDLARFAKRLPGAAQILAEALGMSPTALQRQIERGQVMERIALPLLNQALRRQERDQQQQDQQEATGVRQQTL